MEYYLVFIALSITTGMDRYNLVKAYSPEEAEEKVKEKIRSVGDNPDKYFIQAQKTIE